MATFEISGASELNAAFSRISDVPESVKAEILTEMGGIVLEEIRKSGRSAGIYSQDGSGGHLLDSLTLSKPSFSKNGGSITVRFKGSRRDKKHKKKTTQASVAFYNEYGTRHQQARPFVRPGAEKARKRAFAAGEEIFKRWLKQDF